MLLSGRTQHNDAIPLCSPNLWITGHTTQDVSRRSADVCLGCVQFDIVMLDVAAPDPTADPGTLNSIPAQFLSAAFVLEGLQRRLR